MYMQHRPCTEENCTGTQTLLTPLGMDRAHWQCDRCGIDISSSEPAAVNTSIGNDWTEDPCKDDVKEHLPITGIDLASTPNYSYFQFGDGKGINLTTGELMGDFTNLPQTTQEFWSAVQEVAMMDITEKAELERKLASLKSIWETNVKRGWISLEAVQRENPNHPLVLLDKEFSNI